MKTFLLSATAALALATPAVALGDSDVWHADFDVAVEVAKEQGKDLFVDFTGSDWCGWCHKLDDEVFSHDAFLDEAQKDFVLVALDFPRAQEVKDLVPNPERNDELQAKYGIQGFPTCLLMNTDGVVFGRMGYQPDGPEKYIADMREMTTEGKRLLAELAKLETEYAAASDKAPVVRKAVDLLADMDGDSPGVSIVADMAREALTLDADNESGLKLAAIKSLLGAGQGDDALFTMATEMDSHNEHGLLEQVVSARFGMVRSDETAKAAIAAVRGLLETGKLHDELAVKRMVVMAALWSKGPLADEEAAKELATLANGLEGELDEGMAAMLADILG